MWIFRITNPSFFFPDYTMTDFFYETIFYVAIYGASNINHNIKNGIYGTRATVIIIKISSFSELENKNKYESPKLFCSVQRFQINKEIINLNK